MGLKASVWLEYNEEKQGNHQGHNFFCLKIILSLNMWHMAASVTHIKG